MPSALLRNRRLSSMGVAEHVQIRRVLNQGTANGCNRCLLTAMAALTLRVPWRLVLTMPFTSAAGLQGVQDPFSSNMQRDHTPFGHAVRGIPRSIDGTDDFENDYVRSLCLVPSKWYETLSGLAQPKRTAAGAADDYRNYPGLSQD